MKRVKILFFIFVLEIMFSVSCTPSRFSFNNKYTEPETKRTLSVFDDWIKPKSPPVKITVKEVNESSEFMSTCLKIPVIEGMKDQDTQDKVNVLIGDDAVKFKEDIEIHAKENLEYSKKQGWQFIPYSAYIDYAVTFNKNNILSIPITYESYTGGAHGMSVIISRNIDLRTGLEIQLKDIFKGDIDYKTIIINEINNQIKVKPEEYFDSAVEDIRELPDNQPYYIVDDGIVIYYGLYELAPYAGGIKEFKIPYSLFNNAVKEELLN